MLATKESFIYREEYLKSERAATDLRSEYHKGEIFAMTGASRDHNKIVANVTVSLGNQLKNRDCNNYPNDMKVGVQDGERYLYPDIVVTCGNEEFEDDNADILLNPVVIIEILSPSTEAYDRGLKFSYYQTIESLQEYVLISQSFYRIEVFRKQTDETWTYRSFNEPSEKIELHSINCILNAVDVYFKVMSESSLTKK